MPRRQAPANHYLSASIQTRREVNKIVSLHLPDAHPLQHDLITALDKDPKRRFVVGACGTKFGKTYGSTILLVRKAWENHGTLNWWVAPTFAQSKMAYALVKRLLPKDTYKEQAGDLRLILLQPDGSERSIIEFKSGDNEDSLRGFGVHFFIIDEGARIKRESFLSVMTTVTQTEGKGLIISTPYGRGWFYDCYMRGEKQDKDGNPLYDADNPDPWPEWYSIRMPTWSNPHVSVASVLQMKRNLPSDEYEQEYAAKFLLDSAGVFRGIKECIKGTLQKPNRDHTYVMGVDLARLKDYSVITVMDRATKHVVYHDRFNKISWEMQYSRIVETARRYNRATCVMDSTGIGDPIVEAIQRAGVKVIPYKIYGPTPKKQLIDKLRVNIENQKISYPNIPVMLQELERYEQEMTESGVIRFSAPSGYHDDTVISLALANWECDSAPFTYRAYNVRGI